MLLLGGEKKAHHNQTVQCCLRGLLSTWKRSLWAILYYDMLNTSTAATETMPSKSRPVVAFSQPIRPEAFQESDRSTGLDG
jgi:hypothetical protein